jgi:hypothetical protein
MIFIRQGGENAALLFLWRIENERIGISRYFFNGEDLVED